MLYHVRFCCPLFVLPILGCHCVNLFVHLLSSLHLHLACLIFCMMSFTCVCFCMSGAETWTTTKQLEQKFGTAQRAMERRMLNITLKDRIRNSDEQNKHISRPCRHKQGFCFTFSIETQHKITVCARIKLKWSIINVVYNCHYSTISWA